MDFVEKCIRVVFLFLLCSQWSILHLHGCLANESRDALEVPTGILIGRLGGGAALSVGAKLRQEDGQPQARHYVGRGL